MSIKVLFFARIRDELGVAHCEVDWPEHGMDLAALQAALVQRGGETWAEVLGADNVIRAVNHEVSAMDTGLADGDEVAFYPPVTGG